MKYCPKCQRTYSDETLSYCLQDGSTLLRSDPQAETLEVQKQRQPTSQLPSSAAEMIHEKVTLSIGDYYDLKTKHRTIRITFKDIIESDFNSGLIAVNKELAARLHINMGGGVVFGGKETIQHDTNEYLVPVKLLDAAEEPRSVYYFYTSEIQSVFFRVFLEHLNAHSKQAELNFVHLHYIKE